MPGVGDGGVRGEAWGGDGGGEGDLQQGTPRLVRTTMEPRRAGEVCQGACGHTRPMAAHARAKHPPEATAGAASPSRTGGINYNPGPRPAGLPRSRNTFASGRGARVGAQWGVGCLGRRAPQGRAHARRAHSNGTEAEGRRRPAHNTTLTQRGPGLGPKVCQQRLQRRVQKEQGAAALWRQQRLRAEQRSGSLG
jgi:hypothetical protein